MDPALAEGVADALLRHLGLGDAGYVRMRDVVRSVHGLHGLRFADPSSMPGQLAFFDGDAICIRAGVPHADARFAAAHELGHGLLGHPGVPGQRDRLHEQEADLFAGAVLMPWRSVRRAWRTHGASLAVLAALFGVTETAAALRVGETGLSDLVVVVTRRVVRARHIQPFVLPPEAELRRLGAMAIGELRRSFGPGIRKRRPLDDPERVILLYDDGDRAG